ncbi:MAG: long-chain fatty acid--CoA ligase [Spirochaetes bacterium]|jgi:long-chain acyl-CoA synthetase|nr:long-chain fatty acid--CoA ligase [Spirochaetota bacterium]
MNAIEEKNCCAGKPWLGSYAAGVPEKLDYEKICLPGFLERAARQYPDSTALVFMGYTVSYKKLNEMADSFASALAGFGIKKGDSVAIILPNTIQCVAAYYGILKAGAIAVMNNPLYSDKELEHQLSDSESRALVTLDLLADRMIDLRAKTSVKQIVVASIGDYLPFPKSLLFPLVAKKKKLAADVKSAPMVYFWKELIKNSGPDIPAVNISFHDTAQYQYTGGTTGVSKGVVLTHGNLSRNVQQIASWFPDMKNAEETMLGALPYFHVFGLTVSMNLAVFKSWKNVLVPKPQTEQLIEVLKKDRPSFVPMVPTMYIGIINHPGFGKMDLSFINGCFSGSAPLPVEVIKTFESKSGTVICEGFGMTESSPVTHVNPFEKGKPRPGSIGIPVPDTECRIVDIEDRSTDVPAGKPGELIIRGPQVMEGYKDMPDETSDAIRGGWLHTGDVATMDDDGYFYIVDRLKDMIISGGYNVYPREIDEVVYTHPGVLEACAIGIPHPTRGEAIKLFAVLRDGVTCTEDEMIDFCRDKLATYKLPSEIEFRKELPKSAVGKILRKELRAEEMEKRKQSKAS